MLEQRMKRVTAGCLFPAIAIAIGLTVWGAILFVMVHFILKYW